MKMWRSQGKNFQKQIDLRHPLVCDRINFCEFFAANKLDQTLKKLKISTLKSMCDLFGEDISGPTMRKAPFINAIYGRTEVLPVPVKFQRKNGEVVHPV